MRTKVSSLSDWPNIAQTQVRYLLSLQPFEPDFQLITAGVAYAALVIYLYLPGGGVALASAPDAGLCLHHQPCLGPTRGYPHARMVVAEANWGVIR
jgi:hypothetical protein